MTETHHECPDLDRLLRLIGILGSPADPGFWDRWQTEDGGYGFKKIKAGIAQLAQPADERHSYWARDFADYVLMLFATETPEEERKLADEIGRHITSGSHMAVGTQFLADLRATAWQVWRDHHGVDSAAVIRQWGQVPYPGERS
ncbi:hypothetical protein [Streptomyces sclerotialus]|uniref:hypothetical protein n=1 Tax=Streptomyces sclerotialus TaxID=1957 RepID=UPI000A90A373